MSYLEEERLAQEIKDRIHDENEDNIKVPSGLKEPEEEKKRRRALFIDDSENTDVSTSASAAKSERPAESPDTVPTSDVSDSSFSDISTEEAEPASRIGGYSDIEPTMALPFGKKLLNESLEDKSAFNAFFRDSFAYNLMVTADKRYEYAGKDPEFNLAVALEEAGIPEDATGAYEWCENRDAFDFQRRLMLTREEDKRIREEAGFLTGIGYRFFFAATTDAPVSLSLLLGSTVAVAPVANAFAWAGVPATLAGLAVASIEGGLYSGAESLLKKTVNENETYGDIWDRTKSGALAGLIFNAVPVVGKFSVSQARRVAVVNKLIEKSKAHWEIGKFNFELGTFHAENSVYRMEQLNRCYEFAFKWTPLGRCATSKSATLNKLGLMAFRSDYATAYAKAGEEVFPSIVALKELHNNKLLILKSDYLDIKKDFLRSEFAKANNVGFEEEVRKCIWNNGKHESQEVVEAATLLNNYKNNKMREAHEHGVFDGVFSDEVTQTYLTKDESMLSREDLLAKLMTGDIDQQAVWYFPRIYDKRAVIVKSNEIKELLKKGKVKEQFLVQQKKILDRHDQSMREVNKQYLDALIEGYKHLGKEAAAVLKKIDAEQKRSLINIQKKFKNETDNSFKLQDQTKNQYDKELDNNLKGFTKYASGQIEKTNKYLKKEAGFLKSELNGKIKEAEKLYSEKIKAYNAEGAKAKADKAVEARDNKIASLRKQYAEKTAKLEKKALFQGRYINESAVKKLQPKIDAINEAYNNQIYNLREASSQARQDISNKYLKESERLLIKTVSEKQKELVAAVNKANKLSDKDISQKNIALSKNLEITLKKFKTELNGKIKEAEKLYSEKIKAYNAEGAKAKADKAVEARDNKIASLRKQYAEKTAKLEAVKVQKQEFENFLQPKTDAMFDAFDSKASELKKLGESERKNIFDESVAEGKQILKGSETDRGNALMSAEVKLELLIKRLDELKRIQELKIEDKAVGLFKDIPFELYGEESLEEYARHTYNAITGVNKNSDYISSVPRVSSDKSRTVLIHDEVLEPYLLNDPLKIIEALHNDLSPAIQINKTLKAYGMKEWNDFHAMIDKEFHDVKQLITDEAESVKLQKQYKKDKDFIDDVHELLMGSYGSRISNATFAAWIDSALQLVYAARMGPLLLTSFGDLSHIHAEYGALAPMGKGIVHFVKNVGQGMANAVKGGVNFMAGANLKKGLTKHEKAIGEELHIMGVAMDSAAARIRSRLGSEMPQPDNMNTDWFTRNINKKMKGFADVVTKLTGIHHWDDAMRTIVAQLHGHELLGICKDSLTRELTQAEKYFLSKNRIPISSAKEIGKRFEAHGGEFEKMRVANSHRWADDAITEQYQASVLAKTRIVMPMPGAGDTPLWANNSVAGKLAMQFKSYSFKHYSELVRRMCSDETPRLRKFTAVALATSLNYLSTLLKSAASGDMYDWDDPQLLKDSLIKNLYMIDILLRFTDDLEYNVKRHGAPIGLIASVAGQSPVIGYLSDAVNIAWQARKERPLSERELKTMWGLGPLISLPYVNPVKSMLIKKHIEQSGGEPSLTKHERRIEREFAE